MKRILVGALVVLPLVVVFNGCKKTEAPVTAPAAATAIEAKTFTIVGEVLGFQAEGQVILLKHHKIEGLMDAMTMGFELKDKTLGQSFKKGDQVTGTLVVAGDDIKITQLAKTTQ